jgi:hypothetical protein
MEWSDKTFNFFMVRGYRDLAGGLFRIKGGDGVTEFFCMESDEAGITEANVASSFSFDLIFPLQANSIQATERTKKALLQIVIQAKETLKKQKKNSLQ